MPAILLFMVAAFSLAAFSFYPSYFSEEKVNEREEQKAKKALVKERKIAEARKKLAEVNSGDKPIVFDRLYYISKIKDVEEIKQAEWDFEDDFEDNFEKYEDEFSKKDILKTRSYYLIDVEYVKKDEKWKYIVDVEIALQVDYQRFIYSIGKETYKKRLGKVEFDLILVNNKIALGNPVFLK